MRLASPLAALAATLLLSVSALAIDARADTAASGPVLHRPDSAEPDSLDPQKTTSADSIGIDADMFIGLTTLTADNKLAPGAAESWEVSPDSKVWTFHLRKDMKWSNGDPLTSADFLYSFRRLVDPKTGSADFSDLKQVVNAEAIAAGKEKDLTKLGVEAPDPQTLRITLTQPRAIFALLMSDPQVYPLHKATVEKYGDDWTRPGKIVSNGPYMMKSWTPQSEITLDKNPNFFDAKGVKIGEVQWLVTADPETGIRRYRAGELDITAVDKVHLAWARKNMADQLHTADVNSVSFLFFNMTKGPLAQDIRLRKALNLALDRETIVTKVNPVGAKAAYGINPPVLTNYTPQSMPFKDEPMPQRLDEAKKLLAEAGYGPDHPLAVTVSYPTAENGKQILLAIKSMWQPLGIDVTLENSEWQVFVDSVNHRNVEIGMMGGVGSYDDPENGLENYASFSGSYNWCGYNNPKFDELFLRGSAELDPAKRRKLMEEAESTVLADYPLIPLNWGVANRLVSPKLHGVIDNSTTLQTRYLSLDP